MKGKQLSYDGQGNLQNENGLTKLRHGTLEWANYLKMLKAHGFCDVTVAAAFDGKTYEVEEIPTEIEIEVANAFKDDVVPLTPAQHELAELKAELAEMKAMLKPAKEKAPVKEVKEDKEIEVKEERTLAPQSRGRKPNEKKKK